MKVIRVTAAWTLGIAGMLFAGSQLLQAAETDADRAAAQVPVANPSAPTGITLATMSSEERTQHQEQIERLRKQYGAETLSRLVFESRDGQLRITGFKVELNEMSEGGSQGPSCT